MISAAWLTAGAAAVGVLCVALALITAVQRALREGTRRRHARIVAPIRPLVLALAAGADDGEALQQLTALDRATWAITEPLVVAMLGKVRGEARDGLVTLLHHHGAANRALRGLRARSMSTRARAAETLGMLQQGGSVPALLTLLSDPAPDVRQVAVRSLGLIADPTAVDALLAAVDGERAVPVQTIAQALLRIGPPAAPTLITALQSESEPVRAVAVEVLGLFQAVAAVGPISAALAADPSLAVRIRAATALGRLGHPAGARALLAVLNPPTPATPTPDPLRAAAANALGDLGSATAIGQLGRLLADPAHEVARNAAAALARLGPPGLAALTDAMASDPAPAGTTVVVHRPSTHGAPGAHAAAALASVQTARGRASG